MPYLLENNQLTTEEKESVEKKISEWKATVFPTDLTWLYGLIALVVIVFAVVLMLKKKKPAATPPPPAPTNS